MYLEKLQKAEKMETVYIHEDMKLDRTLPEHHASTNIGDQNVYKQVQYENEIGLERNIPNGSFYSNPAASRADTQEHTRDYKLAPKIQPGGYSIPTQVPMTDRMMDEHTYESERSRMSRMVNAEMAGRFDKPFPMSMAMA